MSTTVFDLKIEQLGIQASSNGRCVNMGDSDNAVMDSKRYTEEELKNLQDLKSKCENAMTAIRELGICLATKDGSGLPHAQERHRNRFGNRTFSKEDFQRDILSEDLGIYVQNKLKQYCDFIDAACEDRLDDAMAPFSPRSSATLPIPACSSGGNVHPNLAVSPRQSSFGNNIPMPMANSCPPRSAKTSPNLGAQATPSEAETRRSSIFDMGSPCVRSPKPFLT